MRKINTYSTLTNAPGSVMSDATTWGQLKLQLGDLIQGDMKAVIKETKVTLENELATLPEGEFTVFLFPNKVKSGASI